MKYIRIDSDNTHNLIISYTLIPFNSEDCSEKLLDFISYFTSIEYNEAVESAMRLLKEPESVMAASQFLDIGSLNDLKALSDELKDIEGYFIDECLGIYGKDWTCVEVPSDYIYNVGQVYKEYDIEDKPLRS